MIIGVVIIYVFSVNVWSAVDYDTASVWSKWWYCVDIARGIRGMWVVYPYSIDGLSWIYLSRKRCMYGIQNEGYRIVLENSYVWCS